MKTGNSLIAATTGASPFNGVSTSGFRSGKFEGEVTGFSGMTKPGSSSVDVSGGNRLSSGSYFSPNGRVGSRIPSEKVGSAEEEESDP
jgi:hypothetical protein